MLRHLPTDTQLVNDQQNQTQVGLNLKPTVLGAGLCTVLAYSGLAKHPCYWLSSLTFVAQTAEKRANSKRRRENVSVLACQGSFTGGKRVFRVSVPTLGTRQTAVFQEDRQCVPSQSFTQKSLRKGKSACSSEFTHQCFLSSCSVPGTVLAAGNIQDGHAGQTQFLLSQLTVQLGKTDKETGEDQMIQIIAADSQGIWELSAGEPGPDRRAWRSVAVLAWPYAWRKAWRPPSCRGLSRLPGGLPKCSFICQPTRR